MIYEKLTPEQRGRWLEIEHWYNYHSRYRSNDLSQLTWARDCAIAELLGKRKPRKSKNYDTNPSLFK